MANANGCGALLAAVFYLSCLVYVQGEVFTAIFEMENLIFREREIVVALKDYLKQEEARLEKIRRYTQKVDEIHAEIDKAGQVEEYLGHPTNAFLLIKRFVKELPAVEEMANVPSNEDLVAAIDVHRRSFPDIKDLDGAITAIFRVQEIFKVQAPALANDLIPSQTRAQLMNVDDIITVAKKAYFDEDFRNAKKWYDTALEVWEKGRYTENDEKVEILDYLSYVEYKLKNFKRAYNLTLSILMTEPTHERAQKNLKYYADQLKLTGQLKGKRSVLADTENGEDNNDDEPNIVTQEDVSWKGSNAYRRYQKLCRGDANALHNNTLHEVRQLKCWFHHLPWLHLRGIGVERLHITPEIIYFRNVLTDNEIEVIKHVGRPKLKRAIIHHPVTGNPETADYRISKSGWVKDDEDPIIKRISDRTEHLTGLTLSTAEELQVNTYGMGGHYEPHYDHAQDHEDKFTNLGVGNRLATVLYYMSDVQLGGGTVFINIGALVNPRKGDGVFWHNLFRNGNGNDMTRHAACPVFVGTKWVANKWIHEYGQEFRYQCTLNENE